MPSELQPIYRDFFHRGSYGGSILIGKLLDEGRDRSSPGRRLVVTPSMLRWCHTLSLTTPTDTYSAAETLLASTELVAKGGIVCEGLRP